VLCRLKEKQSRRKKEAIKEIVGGRVNTNVRRGEDVH